VAYDQQLADRLRQLLSERADLSEKKMFGGVAFLIEGNMAVAASGQGGLMVRVGPAQSATLVATTPARMIEMQGRQMPGWLRVDSADLAGHNELEAWVARGVSYATTLPPKGK